MCQRACPSVDGGLLNPQDPIPNTHIVTLLRDIMYAYCYKGYKARFTDPGTSSVLALLVHCTGRFQMA
jgi:hypothetical protein